MKNPPAFPNSFRARTDQGRGELVDMRHDGMTLRDYFAAKALQGLCADPATTGMSGPGIAEEAYQFADAMLAAREVPK